MSGPAPATAEDGKGGAKGGSRKKLIILVAVVLLLGGGGAGAWFSGVLPRLLGKGEPAAAAAEAKDGHGEGKPAGHGAEAKSAKPEPAKEAHGAKPAAPASAHGAKPDGKGEGKGDGKAEAAMDPSSPYMDLPDIVANLNGGPRRTVFVKLRAKLELAKPEDREPLQAAMPRLLDLFQGYLREMRPEELRGTGGTYRLREELLARTNLAAPPARVTSVLFTEMLIQ